MDNKEGKLLEQLEATVSGLDKPQTVFVNFSATLEVDAEKLEGLKRLEHHIEELFDLDSWPEIRSVSDVQVKGQ